MDNKIFHKAYFLAQKAAVQNEVPIGAVVFDTRTNEIIASAFNQTEQKNNPTAHAELIAIQKACRKLKTKRLHGCSLFVTLEPCAMCAGAVSLARLDYLYFGAYDPKTGGVCQGACVFDQKQTHHKPAVSGGLYAQPCGEILTRFFKQKRKEKLFYGN